jgi:hypothetical protein
MRAHVDTLRMVYKDFERLVQPQPVDAATRLLRERRGLQTTLRLIYFSGMTLFEGVLNYPH